MELRQLRHFLEIYRRASFGQAAEALGLTQPALSKSIRNLEQELRVPLLERLPTGVAPTAYGRILAEYAALVENELRRARAEIESMRGTGKGMVSVGGGTSTLRYLVPPAAAAFAERHPDVRLRLVDGVRDELIPQLRRGDIDVAVFSAVEGPLPDLTCETLMDDELAVVAWRRHPLVERRGLGWADLVPYLWVFPNQREAERQQLAGFFEADGLPPPRPTVETNSSVLMANILPGTEHLSYLPRRMLLNDPGYAELAALDIGPRWPAVQLVVAHRRASVLLPAVRAFVAQLKQTARAMRGAG